MTSLRLAAGAMAALLAVGGCGKRASEVAPARAAKAHGIDWYAGSVDQAFAEAASRNLPIFLYWGAEWCPPCHEIKATVFRSREFIERSRLFIPVYLDGDAENAQAIGERFGVRGYPTMVVFSPAGEEITRIPGGIDIQAYANVLDLAIGTMKPVPALLGRALDEDAALDPAECRLMAYYSWEQNPALLEGRDQADVFERLAAACPQELELERTKLRLAGIHAAIAPPPGSSEPAELAPEFRREALETVRAMLDDEALVRANLYSVLIAGARITSAVTDAGSPERAELESKFASWIDRLGKDESLFRSERLYALLGKMRFERIGDAEAPLSAGLREEIRRTVAEADAATTDPYERQSVINVASAILDMAGMKEEAKTMLLAELERSKQPYYFMTGLADIEQQAGNHEAAIGWLARGYDEARGPATRFQWGTYYIVGLLEMTPEDEERIAAETVRVVGELGATRAFHQRPKAQLARLQKRLEEWNEGGAHAEAIGRIRQGAMAICAGIPADDSARTTCESFLAPA
jgi:thiol-disulfide isomerase/thioredoxin